MNEPEDPIEPGKLEPPPKRQRVPGRPERGFSMVRRGYDVEQVDRFLDSLGTLHPGPTEIRRRGFAITKWGYNHEEVREFLHQAAKHREKESPRTERHPPAPRRSRLPGRLLTWTSFGLLVGFFVTLGLPGRPWWLPWSFVAGIIVAQIARAPGVEREAGEDRQDFEDATRDVLAATVLPESLPEVLAVWSEMLGLTEDGSALRTTTGRDILFLRVQDRELYWSDAAEDYVHDTFLVALTQGIDPDVKFEIPFGKKIAQPRTRFGSLQAADQVRDAIGRPDIAVLALGGWIACQMNYSTRLAYPSAALARECVNLASALERAIDTIGSIDTSVRSREGHEAWDAVWDARDRHLRGNEAAGPTAES